MEERAVLFCAVWPLRSKKDIFRCVSEAKMHKSSGDWNIKIYGDVDKMITAHKEREAKQAATAEDEYVASEEEGRPKSRRRVRRV